MHCNQVETNVGKILEDCATKVNAGRYQSNYIFFFCSDVKKENLKAEHRRELSVYPSVCLSVCKINT